MDTPILRGMLAAVTMNKKVPILRLLPSLCATVFFLLLAPPTGFAYYGDIDESYSDMIWSQALQALYAENPCTAAIDQSIRQALNDASMEQLSDYSEFSDIPLSARLNVIAARRKVRMREVAVLLMQREQQAQSCSGQRGSTPNCPLNARPIQPEERDRYSPGRGCVCIEGYKPDLEKNVCVKQQGHVQQKEVKISTYDIHSAYKKQESNAERKKQQREARKRAFGRKSRSTK